MKQILMLYRLDEISCVLFKMCSAKCSLLVICVVIAKCSTITSYFSETSLNILHSEFVLCVMKFVMAARQQYDDGQGEKSCRACVDFKSWIMGKRSARTSDGSSSSSSSNNSSNNANVNDKMTNSAHSSVDSDSHQRKNCPLDKEELGRSTWGVLHSIAAYLPELLNSETQQDMRNLMRLFSLYYPCEYCAKDMREELAKNPPDVLSRRSFSQWLLKLMNDGETVGVMVLSLMAGLMSCKPDDAIQFMVKALKAMKAMPSGALKWDTFIDNPPVDLTDKSRSCSSSPLRNEAKSPNSKQEDQSGLVNKDDSAEEDRDEDKIHLLDEDKQNRESNEIENNEENVENEPIIEEPPDMESANGAPLPISNIENAAVAEQQILPVNVPLVLLLGCPGSVKTSCIQHVMMRLNEKNVFILNVSEIIKLSIEKIEHTDLEALYEGRLVNDDLVNRLVNAELLKAESTNPDLIIINGYPLTLDQLQYIKQIGDIRLVILIDYNAKELEEQLYAKRLSPEEKYLNTVQLRIQIQNVQLKKKLKQTKLKVTLVSMDELIINSIAANADDEKWKKVNELVQKGDWVPRITNLSLVILIDCTENFCASNIQKKIANKMDDEKTKQFIKCSIENFKQCTLPMLKYYDEKKMLFLVIQLFLYL
ncbi:Erv1 / Alr family protein [Trichinella spiralis]|uniref:Erv1 / Alr family protein n=1 Tax=Trichinella spiralis TaxID=6334 RepID=UPI0001EFBA3A|nr:Erv1 / Alr family protein [Trichinella spiralis]